ncbi:hypothetical protein FACS1894198_2240 [Clostridia bacterium]|nr:hypothetical protein FACS1894198_2240 [Clostridia bacterium]
MRKRAMSNFVAMLVLCGMLTSSLEPLVWSEEQEEVAALEETSGLEEEEVNPGGEEEITAEPSPFEEFKESVESVVGSETINLTESIDIESSIEVSGNVTLRSSSNVVLQRTNFDGPLFKVKSGGRLTISGIAVDGNEGQGSLIENDGTLSLSTGSALRWSSSDLGGAVYNTGTLNMSGGVITNCDAGSGGAIYNTGIFNMTGGEIFANKATVSGGGVFNEGGGEFSMTGGEISQNEAATGAAVYCIGTFNIGDSAYIPYGNGNDVALINRMITVASDLTGSSLPVATLTPKKSAGGLVDASAGTEVASYSTGVVLNPSQFACSKPEFGLYETNRKLVMRQFSDHVCTNVPAFMGQTPTVRLHFDVQPGNITGILYDKDGNVVAKSRESFAKVESEEREENGKDSVDVAGNKCSESGVLYEYKMTISGAPSGECLLYLFDDASGDVVGEVRFSFDKIAPQIKNATVKGATSAGTNTYKLTEEDAYIKFYYEDAESGIATVVLKRPVAANQLTEEALSSDSGGDFVNYKVTAAGTYEFIVRDIAGNENSLKYTFTKEGDAAPPVAAGKTSTTVAASASPQAAAVVPVGSGPIEVKVFTVKEPKGKVVQKISEDQMVRLSDFVDQSFFEGAGLATNKIEVGFGNATIGFSAADIMKKVNPSTAVPAATAPAAPPANPTTPPAATTPTPTVQTPKQPTQTGPTPQINPTTPAVVAAVVPAATPSTEPAQPTTAPNPTPTTTPQTTTATTLSDSAKAVNYLKQFAPINLGMSFVKENGAKIKEVRAKNSGKFGEDEELSVLSFLKKQNFPCDATVRVVLDSVAAARSISLPVVISKLNNGLLGETVSSKVTNDGEATFVINNTQSDFVIRQPEVGLLQKDGSYIKMSMADVEKIDVEKVKEALKASGVKGVVFNGAGFLWKFTKSQFNAVDKTETWNMDVQIKPQAEVKSKFKKDAKKSVIIDYKTDGLTGVKSTLYVMVEDSLKNEKGIKVYRVKENGKLVVIAKNKTVSKNGIVMIKVANT